MADQHSRNPAAPVQGAGLPATQPGSNVEYRTIPDLIDRNGFDPADFEWRPVPRRPRSDGWTPEAQQRFIEALARTGVVERACEEVGLSVRSAYSLRNAPGGEGFARAWAAVLTRAADRLLDIAFEQAIEGEEVPIFDQDGVRTGSTRRYNTRMAMFLLRAYHPERFRHANKDTRNPQEVTPPPAQPVPAVVEALAPVAPAEPHRLCTPERLDTLLDTTEAMMRVEQWHPSDDREPYRRPSVPADDERVTARARMNRRRRERAEQREAERQRQDHPETSLQP